MSTDDSRNDYFDKARSVAVAGMLAAGLAAIIGALLDWITISDLPPIVPPDQIDNAQPVSGIETGDGWWIIIAGMAIVNGALLLWIKRSSVWAWVGFAASVAIGGIAIADYRAIAQEGSRLLQELEVIGRIDQGIGIILVLAAALLGVIFSLIGVAATPYQRP